MSPSSRVGALSASSPDSELDCHSDILVLGIGNLLWADEGFGIRALESLQRQYRFGPCVRLLDGGTQGLYLLPYVEHCRHLLILDAVDFGLTPGTIQELENDAVPAFLGAKKMSLHQTGFQEVLTLARLKGWAPEHLALLGVQPQTLEDYGGSLSAVVKQRIPEVLDRALVLLRAWGALVELRGAEHSLSQERQPLALSDYEAGRPSAQAAYRAGDARFLVGTGNA